VELSVPPKVFTLPSKIYEAKVIDFPPLELVLIPQK
jgi:hypothetical protein